MLNTKRTNTTNRLDGSFRAIVTNVKHPKGLYMAQIRIMNLWDEVKDRDLPWAEFLLPLGAKVGNGHAVPVEVDDLVWVDFPRMGDTRYPRITGSVYYAPDHTSHLPDEVNGKAYKPKRGDGEPKPPSYTLKDDLYDRWGLREHRTVKGGWSITHKSSGTAIEMTEDGQIVIHAEGNLWESLTGNKTQQIGGALKVTILGDANVNVKGGLTAKVDGSTNVTSKGSITFKTDGDFNLKAGGKFAVTAASAPWILG